MPDNYKTIGSVSKGDSLINGSATGAEVDMYGYALAGIIAPASMAGTSMTFEVSVDGGTNWYALKDETNTALSVTIGATAAFYSLRKILPLAVGLIRPVSGASETNKTITFVGQRVV